MDDANVAETLATLQYANRASKIRNCPVMVQHQTAPDVIQCAFIIFLANWICRQSSQE